MVDSKQPTDTSSTGQDILVKDLLDVVGHDLQSINPSLLSGIDLKMLAHWQEMANGLIQSKFDGLVSDTFNAVSFAGLNDFISSRYLSDDPSYSFGRPTYDRMGHFGYLENIPILAITNPFGI